MPWTVEDVEKFKKGLSLRQKKKWVKIANEVLDACETAQGKECDVHAIRVANSRVGRDEK